MCCSRSDPDNIGKCQILTPPMFQKNDGYPPANYYGYTVLNSELPPRRSTIGTERFRQALDNHAETKTKRAISKD